mgnify:CR=1 FL=1
MDSNKDSEKDSEKNTRKETEKTMYLWRNNLDQSKQFVVYYMNEKDEKISGNIVTESSTVSPYSENSIYSDAICVGIAHTYIGHVSPYHIE